MREELRLVYWLGGSPCAGKSAMADLLAERHGLTVYRCDDAFYDHKERIDAREQPVFARLARASCDGIWLRPVGQQIREEMALYREEFPLILADLAAMPAGRPILAEGAALLPELVGGLGVPPERAIWVVPTEAFQRRCYGERAWRHEVLKDCSDRAEAWERWMARDAGFARAVARGAGEREFRVVVVDGARSIGEHAGAIEGWFGLTERRDERRERTPNVTLGASAKGEGSMGTQADVAVERASEWEMAALAAIDPNVAPGGSRERFLADAVAAGRCLVAHAGGAPAGFAVWERSFYDNGFVSLLFVHPDHRRRGVGSALMRSVETICPTEKLFTSTNASNLPMQRLCEGLGFVRSGYIENLDEGDPEIVYFKRVGTPAGTGEAPGRAGKGARG